MKLINLQLEILIALLQHYVMFLSCLKQDKLTYSLEIIVGIFIANELSSNLNENMTLKKLFGLIK